MSLSGRLNRLNRKKPSSAQRASVERLEDRRLLAAADPQAEFMPMFLVSDQKNQALVRDTNLVDPWGVGLQQSTGDFSISNHGTGVVTQYGGDVNGSPLVPSPQAISVPGGAPTGQAGVSPPLQFTLTSNGSTALADFLFASDSGDINGWNASTSANSAQLAAIAANADYTGLAVGQTGQDGAVVYAADFAHNRIDMFNSSFQPVSTQGLFTDPNLPAGWGPYNIANLNGSLFVAYAKQDASHLHPVTGQSNGIIDIYSQDGVLQNRLVTSAAGTASSVLDAPWGMAIAPTSFAGYGGDLLVANVGTGQINVFSLSNVAPNPGTPPVSPYVGTLLDPTAQPLTIDGLRGLIVGNDNSSGSSSEVYFTAGPNNAAHGLFGALTSIDNSSGNIGNPLVADGLEFPVTFGTTFNGSLATFSDVFGQDTGVQGFTITIDWGDGSASPGTVLKVGANQYLVQGSHTYSKTGAQQIQVSIADAHSNAASVQSVAVVSAGNSGNTLTLSGTDVTYVPGTAFTAQVASFTDSDGSVPASGFAATIDWGDGTTSTGTVSQSGSGFALTGTHTYAQSNTFNIVSTVSAPNGDTATVTSTAAVAGSDVLTATAANITTSQGTSFTKPITLFTDTNTSTLASDFTATIDWGDGSSSAGTVTGSAGNFTVSGTHTYSQPGTESAVVSISQNPPGTATATPTSRVIVLATGVGGGGGTGGGGSGGGGTGGGGGGNGNFQDWINSLFQDLLGRVPDFNAMAFFSHLAVAGQRQQVVNDILNSGEHLARQVNSLFTQYLQRAADPGGLAYFTSLLASGGTPSDVAATLAASQEFYTSQGGGTDTGFLNALFQTALGRPIDAAAQTFFLGALASGESRQQVAATVLSSSESRSNLVNSVYQEFLNRSADPAGLQYWTSQLQAVGIDQVIAGIASSDEFFNGMA